MKNKLQKFVKSFVAKLKELKFTKFITYNLDLKYFDVSEFASPDEIGSGSKMNKTFLEKLDYARHNAGVPFVITSGYRTEERNKLVGGRVGSSHLKGLAADISYTGSRERFLIINSLLDVGINRIGIHKSFIHCDVDNLKDSKVIWLYE